MASGIPEATRIILAADERARLEGLSRSTKTEHRLRQRARIVLQAANGMATAAIGRMVGCTTGTASKWRGTPGPGRGGVAGPRCLGAVRWAERDWQPGCGAEVHGHHRQAYPGGS